MKRILLIFFSLSLFWSIPVKSNTLTIKNQVIKTKGDVFYKWPHKWQYNYDMSFWKPYMIQEVSTNVNAIFPKNNLAIVQVNAGVWHCVSPTSLNAPIRMSMQMFQVLSK